jgi:hypothetical protein
MALIYTFTIFTSAFLLFLIQPMISKLLLPQLGGSPAVWNTAMMFFQILLLLGYLYAHLSSKWLGAKKQSLLHASVLLLALLWLPISLNTNIHFSSSEYPITWVITSLLFSVGLPFFVLAANAPLIQFWMANTTHRHAQNPYFLYSASNVGSLLALLSYPFIIEPALTLPGQTSSWSILFIVYGLLVLTCAYYLRKCFNPEARLSEKSARHTSAPSGKTKLYWIALAFFPSSLMLGLTTYITTDIASIPLFWIVPLAVYLLTFIIAFSKYDRATDYALKAQNILVPLVVFTMVYSIQYEYANIVLHVTAFFVISLVCHGTLARHKPSTEYLTEYYVWLSFGGMLGGIFNALIAPNIFSTAIEYKLVFVGSLLVRPLLGTYSNLRRERILDILVPTGFTLLLVSIYYLLNTFFLGYNEFLRDPNHKQSLMADPLVSSNLTFVIITFLYVLIMVVIDQTYKRPLRLMLVIASLFAASHIAALMKGVNDDHRLYTNRNFFGITKVSRYGDVTIMTHGTTTHGIQNHAPKYKGWLSSYYVPLGPIMKYLDPTLLDFPYAVIGLGTGTSACAGHKDQVADFYEIDPDMVKLASNPALFTYLEDCPTKHNIILGDGRLEIAKAKDKGYGIIIVDAFSSDAIPIHLITREAIAVYDSKLADNGIIALHVSNRNLNLLPVAARLALDEGFQTIVPREPYSKDDLIYPSRWVLLTRDSTYYERVKKEYQNWFRVKSDGGLRPWTDNYSNILQILE